MAKAARVYILPREGARRKRPTAIPWRSRIEWSVPDMLHLEIIPSLVGRPAARETSLATE